MNTVVHVPAPLREYSERKSRVAVDRGEAATVGEVLETLRMMHPGVTHRVLDERGQVRRHVNVFVGVVNVRDAQGLKTPVGPGVDVFIMPSVSGGV
jgi:sulfur-carrier protein